MLYIATKGNEGTYVNAADLAAAEAYVLTNFGTGYTVVLSPEQPATVTPIQRAKSHREFGALLFETFLNDNAEFAAARGSNFTVQETLDMDTKFGEFGRLCTYGSIPQIAILLPSIPTDAIFTQDRKDKYTAMVTAHLLA